MKLSKINYIHKRIKIPYYSGEILVFIVEDKITLNSYSLDKKELDGYTYRDGSFYVMVLHKKSLTSTIVHESIHIVNFIFKDRGVKLDINNDEHQAYFTTWVFEECEKVLNKYKS